MALQGTLEDFGIADIFQLIGQQQKTGILVLRKEDQTVHITFNNGNIINAETEHRDKSELLGQMMISSNLLSKEKVDEALAVQKKTLQKLGSILIDQGYIQRSELDEFIYLQTKETIFRLFRWNSGTYQFHQQDVSSENEFFQPISAEHILMDGFRMIDEWPSVRRKIGNFDSIIEAIPEKLQQLPNAHRPSLDQDIDAAFSSFESNAGGGNQFENSDISLNPNDERILSLADGTRSVRTVIDHSRLGEFDACLSIASLMEQGWIRLREPKGEVAGKVDALGRKKRTISLYQDYGSQRGSFGKLFGNALYFLAVFFLILGVFSHLGIGPLNLSMESSERLQIRKPVFKELWSDYQTEKIRNALEVYFLERGYYPSTLDVLVESDLLRKKDLVRPWENPYQYRSDGADYSLEKPFI